ncbi:hypothetical protein [Thalassotalea montiporae]
MASITIHAVLFVVIASLAPSHLSTHQANEIKKPLNSYLYIPIKQDIASQEQETEQSNAPNIAQRENTLPITEETSLEAHKKSENQSSNRSLPTEQQSSTQTIKQVQEKVESQLKKSPRVLTSAQSNQSISINPMKQLENMRKSIDAAIVETTMAEHFQHRSVSSMHPNPASVPKSAVPLTQEQIRAINTQQLDSSLSITKTDDGACIITEDLSKVGIEGVTATSWARCGTTKMERMFSEHMKKVREKHFPASR